MVGIVEEQHPDRARLFMQWKQMDWPILVDSLNLLQVPLVPVTLTIDEHGIIRHVRMPTRAASTIVADFLSQDYARPADRLPPRPHPPNVARADPGRDTRSSAEWSRKGEELFLWGDTKSLGNAIDSLAQAVRLSPRDALLRFRLGVAYRKRFDSTQRQAEDFGKAVENWTAALELDPNQYIFRRRIQQYGPRLDKPYPFYDWIETARQDIEKRGETPFPLMVEAAGAELTRPMKAFASENSSPIEPDPEGRITRDKGKLVRAETVIVPDTTSKDASARVHVILRPNEDSKAHWNNEADGVVFWIEPPERWQVDRRIVSLRNPPETVSQEPREIGFEIKGPPRSEAGSVTIRGYALYYVCEDITGVCMYRRQDIPIHINPGR